ncbi:MAG: hypothetical protein QOI57_2195 [Rubrobacteraceae bacterium]|nr:hypothetical protein [Rubrobacteraceae bacterium]
MIRASVLDPRAVQSLREYLDAHAANLERAVRLGEKAERLDKAGIPSESARNRAERAHGEVVAGLGALRASFVEAAGEREGAHAFDHAVKLLCPAFMPRGQVCWRTSGNAPGGATLASGPEGSEDVFGDPARLRAGLRAEEEERPARQQEY